MKGLYAAKLSDSSPNKSQIGYISPFFSELTPA
jgi:hypothetical protein